MTIYSNSETETTFTTKTGNNITFYNLEEKECPRCLKKFFPKHPRTVYCHSDECKKIGWTNQYKKNSATYNNNNKLPKKNCVICDKEFQPRSLANKGVCGNVDCRYQQRLQHNRNHKRRKGKASLKAHHIKQYGLTIEQYEQMEEYQDHRCKICGIHESKNAIDKNGTVRRLAIDHDHNTGQIRGLLCSACNTALGSFKDSVDSLKRAILYLEGSKNSKQYMPNSAIAKKSMRKKSDKKV